MGSQTSVTANGLISRFKSIRDRADTLLSFIEIASQVPIISEQKMGQYAPHVASLVKAYESARIQFYSLTEGKLSLDYIAVGDSHAPAIRLGERATGGPGVRAILSPLEELVVNCDGALGYLDAIVSTVSPEVRDRLDALRKSTAPLEDTDKLLFKHLSKAIDEHEAGHHLAAAIIAGKTADFVCSQLGGQEEKVTQNLIQAGVLESKLKDTFIKGIKKARHYYTHDLKGIPETQEALGIVSDACDLALKFWKAKSTPTKS